MSLRGLFQPLPRGNRYGIALLVIVFIMVTFGTMMIASAAEGQAAIGGSVFGFMVRDLLWLVVGVVAMVAMMVVKLNRLLAQANWLIMSALVALAYVSVWGVKVDGGRRWIAIAGLTVQPSEAFKLVTIIAVASIVATRSRRLADGQHLLVAMWPIFVGLGCIVLGNDLGTTSIVGAIALVMLLAAGMSAFQVAITSGVAITLAILYGHFRQYAMRRFLSFLNPNANLSGLGYQLHQSKIGMGAGSWLGLGYGQSREKWGLLPNPHTDFIFSIIGEEFGFVGTMMVIALFVAFLITATRIIASCPHDLYRLMAIGVTTWITLEALVNIASVVGFWAITGVPLPFFSYGGTALVMELAAVGLLYNIAHQTRPSPPLELGAERPPFVQFSRHGARHRATPTTHQPVRPRS